MAVSRRQFLKHASQALALGALAAGSTRVLGARELSATRGGPYFLQVILGGGIDAIYGFDPKEKPEVEAMVEVPIKPDDIKSVGNLRLGPHVAELSAWAQRMTMVRGVLVHSAAHRPAVAQLIGARLGQSSYNTMQSLSEVIGAHRYPEQPVPSVSLGQALWLSTYKELSQEMIERVIALTPDERNACIAVLRAQLQSLQRSATTDRVRASIETTRETLRFTERVNQLPSPKIETWTDNPFAQKYAVSFQLALWLFEHDLTRSIRLHYAGWDTHFGNGFRQTMMSRGFFPMLARFLKQTETRKNHRGSLHDNLQLMLGSEMGRFPQVNIAGGKHHLPEACFVLMGPGYKQGFVYGETGRRMQSLPVDLRTGRPHKNGTFANMDDLGATVLSAAGVTPAHYGYSGRRMGVLS